MKEFETEYIEKIIDIMKNNELTEVTLEDDNENKSLVIKAGSFKPVVKETSKTAVEEIVSVGGSEEEPADEPKKNIVPIISNMIGLYYAKPSPDAKPFVKEGDRIEEGQVVCLIETIKFMNKITSQISGKITEICLEDGKPVEYGQVIMYVEED